MNNVELLPKWKKNATAEERLQELALMARLHPERFDSFAVVWKEVMPNGRWKFRTFGHNANLVETIGLFEIGKQYEYAASEK